MMGLAHRPGTAVLPMWWTAAQFAPRMRRMAAASCANRSAQTGDHAVTTMSVSYTHLDVYKRQSSVIALLSMLVVCIGTFLLCILEPEYEFIQLLFEVVSAFGTVGLSTGITPDLGVLSKLVIILTMYLSLIHI